LGIESQVEATVSWMRAQGQKTVLCVDDEKIGLRVRKIMLESHGFRVLTANSGRQGLSIFDDHHVDLVVLDYYMPELNGGEVAAVDRTFPSSSCRRTFPYLQPPWNWRTLSSLRAIRPTS
jgi:CheY-like chemotaxis protein